MSDTPKTGRHMFMPKVRELDEQCPSCPFREGNNKEFGVIVTRLRKFHGIPGKATPWDIGYARIEVRKTALVTGDFICHCTAYDQDMNLKPADQHRQCPGATKAFRALPSPQD